MVRFASSERPSHWDSNREGSRGDKDSERDSSKKYRDRDSRGRIPKEDSRGRDRRPGMPTRRSTYNDGDGSAEYFEEDDSYSQSRSSDNMTRRHGKASRRPRSETRTAPTRDSRERDRLEDSRKKRNQVIKAALTAGAFEAVRQRNKSGDWVGGKGIRVATAALSAAAIDAGFDKNPNRGALGNIIKSTIGGVIVDKIANGGRR